MSKRIVQNESSTDAPDSLSWLAISNLCLLPPPSSTASTRIPPEWLTEDGDAHRNSEFRGWWDRASNVAAQLVALSCAAHRDLGQVAQLLTSPSHAEEAYAGIAAEHQHDRTAAEVKALARVDLRLAGARLLRNVQALTPSSTMAAKTVACVVAATACREVKVIATHHTD